MSFTKVTLILLAQAGGCGVGRYRVCTLNPSGRAHEVAATAPALPLGAAGHFGPAPPRDNWLTTRACASTACQ
jgi:hypothetical protein